MTPGLAAGRCRFGSLAFAVRRLREARTLALSDTLTGLPNRRRFDEALREALAKPPGSDSCHTVMRLDLNGFKDVNDVYGHGVGDELLVQVAAVVAEAVESRKQERLLRGRGCDRAQGFLSSAAVDAAQARALPPDRDPSFREVA